MSLSSFCRDTRYFLLRGVLVFCVVFPGFVAFFGVAFLLFSVVLGFVCFLAGLGLATSAPVVTGAFSSSAALGMACDVWQ